MDIFNSISPQERQKSYLNIRYLINKKQINKINNVFQIIMQEQ